MTNGSLLVKPDQPWPKKSGSALDVWGSTGHLCPLDIGGGMTTLSERITAAKPVRTRAEVYAWFDSLTPDDRDAVIVMLLDPDWSHLAIQRLLVDEGIPVGKETVAKWRRSFGFNGRSY